MCGGGADDCDAASARRARAGGVPKGPQKGAPKEGELELPPGATMPMRTLGRTGVKVSLLGLGGFHLGIPQDDKEAVRIIHAAMDHGVTFLDNCWDYNGGKSEERMGMALAEPSRREKAFLMTKLDGRTRKRRASSSSSRSSGCAPITSISCRCTR